jgi:hypothetical protein
VVCQIHPGSVLDPEAPPTFILESRCRNVRVQVIPLSDTTCHHCEAVVKFVKLLKKECVFHCPTSMTFSNMMTLVLSSFFEINVLNEITIFLSEAIVSMVA